ncbi:hypothetical protein INT43_003594 [Umbelopsis isabellina]|uniref:Chromatin modification-related protein EAF3 n=1 Tax=Mortierella isabellina TaxID=91625 RepID=A0A8H7UBU5_MORIS|nr:hypothetical protein INT43_003594 [Umbelopsis isabellina]
MTKASKPLFLQNEKVLCFHGPLIYEAKILQCDNATTNGCQYFVHYKGWKQTWDEWVPETRVLKWTDANMQKQKALRELHTAKKATRTSSTALEKPPESRSSSRKRPRDDTEDKEDDYLKKLEVKIVIPDILKGQLVDDWENVTKNQQLVTLPRKPTISQLLQDYKKSYKGKSKKEEQELNEVISGLRLYFNKALGAMLLYRFERPQYAEIRKTYPKREMSDIYGAEHLLRIFVQLPSLITHTNMDAHSVKVLKIHLAQILDYMLQHKRTLFLSEYINADPGYVSLAKNN